MMGVPAATPVTTPVTEPMLASVVLLLLQKPVPVALVNVVVNPTHTAAVPVIVAGKGLTVIVDVVKHPVDNV